MIGTISNVIPLKKYGFISGENGQEYFFHMTDLDCNWDELLADFSLSGGGKVKVSFEPVKTMKGPRANHVIVMEE